MALTTKRIIALPSQTDPQEGDYLAIDNLQGGTHKIPVGRIGVEVDDTLTEAGKAADAKAVGDALDEIRSQVEATDDAIDEIRSQIEVTGTASGAIATFTDGAEMPMVACAASIVPKQSGTGTPSPDNVRPISGWESVDVNVAGKNIFDISGWINTFAEGQQVSFENDTMTAGTTAGNLYAKPFRFSKTNTTITLSFASADIGSSVAPRFELLDENGSAVGSLTLSAGGGTITRDAVAVRMNWSSNCGFSVTKPQIELGTTATAYEPYAGTTTTTDLGRTVYGGTLDVVSGVLTAYPFYPSYNGETLDGRWICDRAVYAEGTTPPTGSQVALISGTGTTYQLTPTEVKTLLGENNVWADSGDVEVVYVRDLNIAINNLLNSNGTRSLGMMAMSAPTKDTAEEPTDEQTEEPAEDDMR